MQTAERPRHHKIIQCALLTAASIAIGYLFLLLPNFEFVTASIFISGFLMGPLYGLLIGLTAEFLFSMFNPFGAPSLPLLIAQVLSMAVVGWAGGMVGRTHWLDLPAAVRMAWFGLMGFFCTLVFDMLTTLSFAVFIAGGDRRKMAMTFISGMVFYLVHLQVNTVGFAVLVPVMLKRLKRLL